MIASLSRLLAVAALCALAAPALAAQPVTLRAATEVNRPAIRLADVFDGVPSEMDRDIALAPAPGRSVTYDTRVLTKLAEQYKLDWQPQGLADRTVLTRASTMITAEMVQTSVLSKLSQNHKIEKGLAEVTFDNRNLLLHLPADRAPDFEIVNFSYDERARRFRGEIVAQTGGQPINLPVSGAVIIKKNVPVLTRRLAAGTTISPADVGTITLSEAQIGADVLTDAAQIIGLEMRRDVGENEVLRTRDIIPPRLVTRGSLVTLKIETPLMLITAQGRAMQDGAKGEVVRVTNVQSNRIIEGTVEAGGVVRVGTFRKVANAE